MVLILGGELSTDRKCKWVNKKFFEWIKPTYLIILSGVITNPLTKWDEPPGKYLDK